MKLNHDVDTGKLRDFLNSSRSFARRNPARITVLSISIVLTMAALLVFSPYGPMGAKRALSGFEAGKVADRDLTADRDLVFLDEAATQEAYRQRGAKILPVFVMDEEIKKSVLARFGELRAYVLSGATGASQTEAYAQAIRDRYPGRLSLEDSKALVAAKDKPRAFALAEGYLSALLDRGVAAIPEKGLERYNQERLEIHLWRDGKLTTEEIPARSAITMASWPGALGDIKSNGSGDGSFAAARALVKGFLAENLFFDRDLSEKHLESALSEVEPVMKSVSRGEKIVKKGYVVDEAQMLKIRALGQDLPGLNLGSVFGAAGFLFLLFAFGIVLMGFQITGLAIDLRDFLVLILSATSYFLLGIFAARIFPSAASIPFSVVLPTGLVIILVSILHNGRTAVVFTFLLSLSLLGISNMDAQSTLFAFFSGIAAILSAQKMEKRIDLVRAGIYLAVFQAFLILVLDALAGRLDEVWSAVFWAAFNGFFCGMLALGFLPVLESALNAPTRFRLMELSDLNSPLLKRLLTVAPGTYSHSVMVANIAESACRDIHANALLSRVAAYYHDIGKMDQPDYYVENQTSYNRHSEIKPRLSATVIRSHVKVGVEKARAMNLPTEVVDIISQHHGNGLIAYFYNQAVKEEGHADKDDFSYPGSPPKSREAAVVMLADTVEAASRTLKKPTQPKLEQFVDEIIMDKFGQGLLSDSELTFRDLETIKNSFVKILAGHFHSRIEYPKAPKESPRGADASRNAAAQAAEGARG